MTFDIAAAKKAGYSDDEILAFLGKSSTFDVAGAQKAGYSAADILGHLETGAPKTVAPPLQPGFLDRVNSRLPTAGISEVPGAIKDILNGPWPYASLQQGMMGTLGSILTSPKDKFDEARKRGGGYVEAAAAGVPIVGAMVDTPIQDAVAGRGAESLGNVLNLGTMAAAGLGGRVPALTEARSIPSIPPSVGRMATQAVGAAKEFLPMAAGAAIEHQLTGGGLLGSVLGAGAKQAWRAAGRNMTRAEKAAAGEAAGAEKAATSTAAQAQKAAAVATAEAEKASMASARIETKILETVQKAEAAERAALAKAREALDKATDKTRATAESEFTQALKRTEAAEAKTQAARDRASFQSAKAETRIMEGSKAPESPAGGPTAAPAPTSLDPQGRPNLSDPATFQSIMGQVRPRGTLAGSPRGAGDIAGAARSVVEKLHREGRPTPEIIAAVAGIPEIAGAAPSVVEMVMKGLGLADNAPPAAVGPPDLQALLIESLKGRMR